MYFHFEAQTYFFASIIFFARRKYLYNKHFQYLKKACPYYEIITIAHHLVNKLNNMKKHIYVYSMNTHEYGLSKSK